MSYETIVKKAPVGSNFICPTEEDAEGIRKALKAAGRDVTKGRSEQERHLDHVRVNTDLANIVWRNPAGYDSGREVTVEDTPDAPHPPPLGAKAAAAAVKGEAAGSSSK